MVSGSKVRRVWRQRTCKLLAIFGLVVALPLVGNLWRFSSTIYKSTVLQADIDTFTLSHKYNSNSNVEQTRPRRMFLGILSKRKADSRLRNVIRKTYLSFDAHSEYKNSSNITSICSFQQYQQWIAEDKLAPSDCPVVYCFLIQDIYKPKPVGVDEPDVIYLNSSKFEEKNHVFEFFDYLVNTNAMEHLDYIAMTNSRVVLFPTILWPDDLFAGRLSPNRLYAGNVLSSQCTTKDGTDLQVTDKVVTMQDYFVLSSDLVSYIQKDPKAHNDIPNNRTEIVIAESLQRFSVEQKDSISTVAFQNGLHQLEDLNFVYLSFAIVWDEYKDKFVPYKDPTEEAMVRSNPRVNHTIGTSRFGPRVLLGIFTMDSEKERKRRIAVRETYLRFFAKSTKNRICSLMDLIKANPSSSLLTDCQLAYVFVMGGNPDGPTERVEFNETVPMTLPGPVDSLEDDIVYLNIQENMKEGKSQSFFKYATTVVDNHVYFEYLGKTDTDTLLIPKVFLNENINRLPRFPDNVRVYGGSPRAKEEYGHLHGPIYNQGLLYWMSVDLARYVTSPACDREHLKVFSEDKSMGNFIHSHPLPIQRYKLIVTPRSFHHPLKDLQEYRDHWNQYKS